MRCSDVGPSRKVACNYLETENPPLIVYRIRLVGASRQVALEPGIQAVTRLSAVS